MHLVHNLSFSSFEFSVTSGDCMANTQRNSESRTRHIGVLFWCHNLSYKIKDKSSKQSPEKKIRICSPSHWYVVKQIRGWIFKEVAFRLCCFKGHTCNALFLVCFREAISGTQQSQGIALCVCLFPCVQAQCSSAYGVISWKSRAFINMYNESDNSSLASISFKKKKANSWLRLTWSSDATQRLSHKCSKWFFEIDNEECSDPAPVDLISYYALHNIAGANPRVVLHRHSTVVGVCRATKAGRLLAGNYTITLSVTSQCNVFRTQGGDAFTGWQSTSTLMVEELCPPQPWSFSWLQSTQNHTRCNAQQELCFLQFLMALFWPEKVLPFEIHRAFLFIRCHNHLHSRKAAQPEHLAHVMAFSYMCG